MSVLIIAAGLTELAVAILRVVWEAGKEVVIRMIDGIDPAIPEEIREGAAAQNHAVVITIHDTGDGVPESMNDTLFSPLTTGKARHWTWASGRQTDCGCTRRHDRF
ncbi:MAG: hypothetical protein ACXV39_07695 [Halobacteriota archaeon]